MEIVPKIGTRVILRYAQGVFDGRKKLIGKSAVVWNLAGLTAGKRISGIFNYVIVTLPGKRLIDWVVKGLELDDGADDGWGEEE